MQRCPVRSLPAPVRSLPAPQGTACGHSSWTIIVLGSQKAQPSLAPPVPHAGCIFRSLSALVKTEGISVSLALPCLRFHWSAVKRSRVHAGSGTDQQVSWECLSGSQRCSRPAPCLSLRFVALLLSCCYCHPPHTPPPAHTKHPDLSWALSLIPGILYIGINRLVTVGELGGRGYIYLSC